MKYGRVRFITFDGKPSALEYLVDPQGPDRKGIVQLADVDDEKNITRVHKRRLLSPDTNGKAIAIGDSGQVIMACPKEGCQEAPKIVDDKAMCLVHGAFEIVLVGINQLPTKPQILPANTTSFKLKEKNAVKKPVIISLDAAAEFGELWSKKVDFDYTQIAAQAHVLLAGGTISPGPPRKLCFNTYNGSLGKKSKDPLVELKLEAFKQSGVDSDGGAIGYRVSSLDAMRKALKDYELRGTSTTQSSEETPATGCCGEPEAEGCHTGDN